MLGFRWFGKSVSICPWTGGGDSMVRLGRRESFTQQVRDGDEGVQASNFVY